MSSVVPSPLAPYVATLKKSAGPVLVAVNVPEARLNPLPTVTAPVVVPPSVSPISLLAPGSARLESATGALRPPEGEVL